MSGLIGLGANQMLTWGMVAPLLASRKGPLKTTTYTSGTGTFTPAVDGGLCVVLLVGAGGGGGRGTVGTVGASGGSGGVSVLFSDRFTGAQSYTVGAAGVGATTTNTNGTAGASTRLGRWVAPGGAAGLATGAAAASVTVGPGWVTGGAGGAGGNGVAGITGSAAGGLPAATGLAAGGTASTGGGGGGGGDSTHGTGGAGGAGGATTGTAGTVATGYGGGGGGGGAGGTTTGNGGNGTGGYILILEYGNV